MAASHSSTTLNSLWKEVYSDKIEQLIPSFAVGQKRYPFQSGKKIGDYYVQPVIVTRSHGFTRGRGLQTLNAAIVHETQQAQLNPFPMYLREIIPYDVAARMTEKGKASFALHSEQLVKQMLESAYYRNELELFYGQDNIGEADSSVNASATSTVVTLTAASFAAGIWAGAENAQLKFHLTSNGNLVSSGADAVFTVDSVDVDNKAITVTGTATGITALDAALGSGNAHITWSDASASAKGDQENPGFKKILTNSGSLFNINAGTYNLWRGNEYSAGSADVTMKKLLQATAKAVSRGLKEDVDCWLSIEAFENLNVDQAALREYSKAETTAENGFDAIKYRGSNGTITIMPHAMVKPSDFFIIPKSRVVRTGSTDITFKLPGRGDEEFFLHKDEQNGYELRCMSEVGVMLTTPARAVYGKDVVNS